MSNDYKEFLKLLNYHKVKYVVVGAHVIKNKLATGRYQDLQDVKRLKELKKKEA